MEGKGLVSCRSNWNTTWKPKQPHPAKNLPVAQDPKSPGIYGSQGGMLRAGQDPDRGLKVLIQPSLPPLGRAESLGSLDISSNLLFLAAFDLNHHNDPKLPV